MLMPFGKFKGKAVANVPLDYLEWMVKSCNLDADLSAAVRARLSNERPPPAKMDGILKEWFFQLTLRFHRDVGGTDEQWAVVKTADEILRGLLAKK